MTRDPRPGRADRGSATVLVLAASLVLGLAGAAAGALGLVLVARHQAEAAADLAALAAAAHVLEGPAGGCAAATASAATNGASLVGCRWAGAEVLVRAEVRLPGVLQRLGPAAADARAGPAVVVPVDARLP